MALRRPATIADAALRLLAHRDYTRQEMSLRLLSKSYGQEEVEETIGRLADWGYLDDRAIAERVVEDCLKDHPRGRSFVASKLLARGIPEATIQDALSAYPLESEEKVARAALIKLGFRLPIRHQERPRAWRSLARLGFAESTIERICGIPDPVDDLVT